MTRTMNYPLPTGFTNHTQRDFVPGKYYQFMYSSLHYQYIGGMFYNSEYEIYKEIPSENTIYLCKDVTKL